MKRVAPMLVAGLMFVACGDPADDRSKTVVRDDVDGAIGWSAARLCDPATTDGSTGLAIVIAQTANAIIGGAGGPSVPGGLGADAAKVGAIVDWRGDLDQCGTGDRIVCTWFSFDDFTEVLIDVRFVLTERGWSFDEYLIVSCGGEGCPELTP